MNKTRAFKTTLAGLAGIIVTAVVVVSTPLFREAKTYATATVSADELYKKALTVALQTCYSDTYMKKDNVSGNTTTVSGFLTSAGKSDGKIVMPTYVGNTLKDSDLSCEQVFDGYSGSGGYSKSIFAAFGKPRFSSSATGTNLVSLGYKPVVTENTAPTGNYKVKVSFDYIEIVNGSASSPYTNRSYTITLDSNGEAIESNAASCYSEATDAWLCVSPIRGTFYTQDGQLFGSLMVRGAFDTMFLDMFNGVSITLFGTGEPSLVYGPATNCNGYVIDEENVAYSCGPNGKIRKFYNFKASLQFEEDSSQVTGSSKYEIQSFSAALATLRLYLGASSYNTFNSNDKKSLYYDHYILSVIKDSTSGTMYVDNNDCMASLTSEIQNSSSDYYLPSNGKWCRLIGSETATVKKNPADNDYKFAIVSSSTSMKKTSGTKAAAFQEVVKELMKISNTIDITDTEDIAQEVNNATTPTDPGNNSSGNNDNNDNNSDAASCFTNGDSLGWILCPTIKMVGSAATAAYENIEHNWLQMDTSFFDPDKGTYEGWAQFRNYANILFSIGFVIIILAQVTGIGISNYNIKKLLPKFIMVVILVNLSFIICQIAVDISNILGSTLYDTFKGLPTGKTEAFGVDNLVVGLLTSVGTGALIGVGAVGIAVAALTSPGSVLIPLLISFIGALISLLFFFIVLAVRKAGIVILVVLAPVAIVCYALPNTKSFFDRWKKLFVSLLMVYPICAVLMGGGYFASNLLLKNGDNGFVETLVALLLQVVPIFLVPGVLRSSLALAGNIGTKLSMMGSNLSRRTTGAIANAEMTKRAQTSMNYWGANTGQKALGKVGGAIGKIPGVGRAARAFGGTGLGKALKAGQTRRVAQNKMAYRKMRLDEGSNEYIAGTMTAQSIMNDLASQKYKQELERIDTTADSIITGNLSYTDNAGEHIVNANDVEAGGSLEQALEYYMNQYDDAIASGDEAAQEEMLMKARAVSKIMFEKGGDTGRSRVMHQLKRHAFDSTGAVDKKASFRGLTKYISQNDKWMGGLKAEDVGGHLLVAEGANFTGSNGAPTHEGTFHSLMHYNTLGGGKVSTSAVPNLSDNFYEGYDDAAASGLYTVGSAAYNADVASGGHGARDLIQLAETLERAMADPTVAQKVKDKDLAKMETIHEQAYNLQRDQWLAANRGKTRADYAAQFGAYQQLTKGKALKISHAKMPAGWKRADSMDVARFRSLGLSEGDWFNNSGFGSRLNAEEIRKAEAIEQQHIDADIQNSL